MQALITMLRFGVQCAATLLVWEVVVKLAHASDYLFHSNSQLIANLVVGSVCLAACLGVGAWLLVRVAQTLWQHKRW